MTIYFTWMAFSLACGAIGTAASALSKVTELEKRIQELETAKQS